VDYRQQKFGKRRQKEKKNQKEMAQNFKTFHFNAPVAKFG
jgi:hypothetical protein